MIAMFAPQVTALFWEPATSENPSGPIPYLISVEERQLILDKIDNLFLDELQSYYSSEGDRNALIFAVDAIKKSVEKDYYEEVVQ